MEYLSKRAFTFSFVVFSLFLIVTIVSSATDEQPQSGAELVASVSKVEGRVEGDRTGTQKGNDTNVKKPNATSESAGKNCTTGNKNDTKCKEDDRSIMTKFWDNMTENRDMLMRTMYVLLGVTGIVIVYFIIRTVRLRRRRSKSRKYGVITTRGDMEMEPLGQGEEEDEDYTVFEMNGRPK